MPMNMVSTLIHDKRCGGNIRHWPTNVMAEHLHKRDKVQTHSIFENSVGQKIANGDQANKGYNMIFPKKKKC